jgi:hypothetical protein
MNLGKAAKLALGATAIGAATPEDADAMYVGPKAKGWDTLKNKFSSLYDKMTRAEISDASAKVNWQDVGGLRMIKQGTPLLDAIHHPELFKMYPDLAKTKVFISPVKKSNMGGGYFSPIGNEIVISPKSEEQGKKHILHEIQHVIQKQEGWPKGGNSDTYQTATGHIIPRKQSSIYKKEYEKIWKDIGRLEKTKEYKADKLIYNDLVNNKRYIEADALVARSPYLSKRNTLMDLARDADNKRVHIEGSAAYNEYKRLAGEIESRDTASRMGLTQSQRASKLPYSSENINPKDAIVKYGVGGLAAGTTLSQAKDALAQKYKKMESDQALQDAYSPVDMIIAGATGGATMGLRAISALADPIINYAIDRMLGD